MNDAGSYEPIHVRGRDPDHGAGAVPCHSGLKKARRAINARSQLIGVASTQNLNPLSKSATELYLSPQQIENVII